MKTQNNKTNQQKFYALYWGQEVAKTSGYEKLKTVSDIIYRNNGMSSIFCTEHLELTPLSQITDEDAIGVAKLLWKGYKYHTVKDGSYYVKAILQFDSEIKDGFELEMYPHNAIKMCDYLRSKGYALPWMGLSVEDLESYGWIKLN